jgi:hypothetical protein
MVFRRAQLRAICGEAARVFQRVPRGDIFRSDRSRSQLAEVGWSRSQIQIPSFSLQLLINRIRSLNPFSIQTLTVDIELLASQSFWHWNGP